jgi:hypothetical protein
MLMFNFSDVVQNKEIKEMGCETMPKTIKTMIVLILCATVTLLGLFLFSNAKKADRKPNLTYCCCLKTN